jgi:hypothetical protein
MANLVEAVAGSVEVKGEKLRYGALGGDECPLLRIITVEVLEEAELLSRWRVVIEPSE